MTSLMNPQEGDKIITESGNFLFTNGALPKTEFEPLDVLGIIAAVLIGLGLLVIAWQAIPKITASIHEAEEVSRNYQEGW